ncbi:MAG: DUF2804 domain-containing protein [Bacillota bacterium]
MQNRITKAGKLLKSDGTLAQRGYATELLLQYERSAIKAKKFKIKEWDYYYIGNKDYGVALTVADNSYLGMMGLSLLDFRKPFDHTSSEIVPFTNGSLKMPATSVVGDIAYKNKKIDISFTNDGKTRRLTAKHANFFEGKPLEIDITLTDVPQQSIVIATPFEGAPTAFYYNQKINCMSAVGYCKFGDEEYIFNAENGSLGTLDWGRGVWTYKNTWYWGSLSTVIDGHKFGFNIGYGFGDTTAASENVLFYDGKHHKLNEVTFNIPKKGSDYDYMSPWTFESDDNRLNMTFTPLVDRFSDTNVGLIRSCQHQVFGEFSGHAILDDGTVIDLNKEVGFAERVTNKW